MKRMTTVLVVGCLAAGMVWAQAPEGVGVGVIVGEPTGLSAKMWLSGDRALDAGAAWSFSGNGGLHLHGDYLFHRFDLFRAPSLRGRLPGYVGIGGRLKLEEDDDDHGADGRGHGRGESDHGEDGEDGETRLGVRVPFGLSYLLDKAPVDLFAEIVPVLDLAPDTDLDLGAAVGARFYF